MDLTNFKKFAELWEQIKPVIKMAFVLRNVGVTANFKKAYKAKVGHEYNVEGDNGVYTAPIAIEPCSAVSTHNAFGFIAYMSNGRAYEGFIKANMTAESKGDFVKLVWLKYLDASKQPLVTFNPRLFKDGASPGKEEGNEV